MSAPQEQFLDMLVAAMLDAATELKITQLQTSITPEGGASPQIVRIVVIPERMQFEFDGKGNRISGASS